MIDNRLTRRLVFLLFSPILLLQWAGIAAAQGGVQILEDQADPGFPDRLDFQLSLKSETPVEEINLIYGTNRRSCQSGGSRQPVQFEPGEEISSSWEWELRRSGAIPPGAQIWWQWEIVDQSGNITTTERRETLFIDESHLWQESARDGVTVHWYAGDEDFADDALDLTLENLSRLSDQIGVSPQESIHLWIYPTAADVREAVVNSSEWTGAVAFTDYNTMVVSLAPGQDEWAADVIPHELTHLVVGMAVFNCRGSDLTVWLSEGLAVFGEDDFDARELKELEASLAAGQLPPLRELADGFSAYGNEAGLAYTHSGQVIAYLAELYGPDQINDLLAAVQSGMTVDNALEQVFGFDTDGLDARWRLDQGYAPTPTSAAHSALAEATPTAVPTIAIFAPQVAVTTSPTLVSTIVEVEPTRSLPTKTRTPTPSPTPLPADTATPTGGATSTPPSDVAAATADRSPALLYWGFGIVFVVSIAAFGLYRVVWKGE